VSHADVHVPLLRSYRDLRDGGKGLRGELGCCTVFHAAAVVRFLSVVDDLIHGLSGARRLHAEEHASWKKQGRPTPIREVTGEEPNRDSN
jgi:hypothetical protein